MPFEGSYLWRIRQKIGNQLVLMPGASVVVEKDDGEVLLLRRSDTGEWCVPAGAAEEGDSFAGTAISELREEAGLIVDESDLIPFGCLSDPGVHIIEYPSGDITHCFSMCFAVRRWTGDLAHDREEMTVRSATSPTFQRRCTGQLSGSANCSWPSRTLEGFRFASRFPHGMPSR